MPHFSHAFIVISEPSNIMKLRMLIFLSYCFKSRAEKVPAAATFVSFPGIVVEIIDFQSVAYLSQLLASKTCRPFDF